MKRILFAIIIGTAIFISCKKDESNGHAVRNINQYSDTTDTTPPVITLVDPHNNHTAFGNPYIDPGAIATDNIDGEVPVYITGPVDENFAGEHTIRYQASDASGNIAIAERKVTVDAAPYVISANGSTNFSVDDTDPQVSVYTDNLTTSSSDFNKIYFNKFAYFEDAYVYAELSGANTVTISEQIVNCGTDNMDRKFTGSGTFSENTLNISYTVSMADGSMPFTGHATYTKR